MKDQLFRFIKFLLNIFIGNMVIRILEPQILKCSFNSNLLTFSELHNTGVAFSLFSKAIPVIIAITIIFLIAFLFFYYKNSEKISKFDNLGYTFLLTGIVANLHQRLIFGYVIDYIQLNFVKFPVFNLADLFISIGITILFLTTFFNKKSYSDKE